MILPFDNSELHVLPPVPALTYETVLCMELPAFDPVPTLRSVLLKPPHLQRFACFLRKTGWLTMTIYGCGLILRIVVCSVPAPIGRLVSPWAAVLHIPPCIVFAAGIRVEFVKLILSAFDFWFPFAANTMFLVIFSCVLRDMRTLLVIAVWIAFGSMRHRLLIKNWMPTCCIALFIVIQLLASLDILVLDYSHLRDRVFWDLNFLGRKAQFRVVTFLWSRVVTIFVWYGRLLYILVTRTHENALIILRGNVEFDYQTWRLQANIAREVRRMAKFAKSIQVTKAAVTSIPE
ncbi:hypothetical protein GN958_ATG10690 [Phytophthora infestans]|uniref:Transmembrane protein n=1 Tax=Phytophthora infestans TaxID=4787 RepID=A0A8S9UH23_PHYIN|nr:hypothetical protein GN958_ATG10690 [Phytophthora infestans]